MSGNRENDAAAVVTADMWQPLRRFTAARIALGRSGASLPTTAHLQFQLAHAQARDAVHRPLDTEALSHSLAQLHLSIVQVASAAADRYIYLQRPDLGRQLDAHSIAQLQLLTQEHFPEIIFVIADGLSALAIERHAARFLAQLLPLLRQREWNIGPVVVAQQARVAIGDHIGALLRAQLVVVLIGERPGLSSPDSMGLYLTWTPQPGRSDAERNCISNIRDDGLAIADAIHRLDFLLSEARRRKLSGVALKDESEAPPLQIVDGRNFLID